MGVEEPKGSTGAPASTTSGDSTAPFLPPQDNHYGTFQGVASYSQQPARDHHVIVGFPPPTAPTVAAPSSYYYPHGYQAVTGLKVTNFFFWVFLVFNFRSRRQSGYVVADVQPLRESPLCCCGIGLGWILFISGFFFAAIPWYVGALILLCGAVDYREQPGLVACMIATVLTMIAIVFGVTGGAQSW